MTRAKRWRYRSSCTIFALGAMMAATADGQELLKAIEPGTGYSRMKQWVVDHRLYFENFTKDSLVIVGEFQESGDTVTYAVRILTKFCAGDDYAGRVHSATLLQRLRTDTKDALSQMFEKHRVYLESLAGKPSQEGNFPGQYSLRHSRTPDQQGVAVGASSDQGTWELGMFFAEPYLTIQVIRNKDELCQ